MLKVPSDKILKFDSVSTPLVVDPEAVPEITLPEAVPEFKIVIEIVYGPREVSICAPGLSYTPIVIEKMFKLFAGYVKSYSWGK